VTRLRRTSPALVAALLMGTIPTAATAYETIGFGTMSCGRWLEDRQSHGSESKVSEGWVWGFISGMNAAAEEFGLNISFAGSGTDSAAQLAWLDNYCHAHPFDTLTEAAQALWHALFAKGLK
jgi:hypothetical protein